MNWFYASNNQQVGPVTESQFDELVRAGKITGETLVWREGLAGWKPLREVDAAWAPAAPGAQIACSECGKLYAPDEVIRINEAWICAQCKPVVKQRLLEGAEPMRGLWQNGRELVTYNETPFPDRCVKCNAPADGFKLKRVLYWQHPAYYLLLLCNLLILVIVILLVRKKATFHVGLCEHHRTQRKVALGVGWLGCLGGLGLIVAAITMSSGWLGLAGAVVFLGCGIYAGIKAPIITASKIDKTTVWIRGAHNDFLAQFPQWPGA